MTGPFMTSTDPHIVLDDIPVTHVHNDDMPRDKEKPRIEIVLDTPALQLRGVGVDVEPARLAGHVALYLTEATSLKEITLNFRGKARLPTLSSDTLSISSNPFTYIVCNHDWSFLEGDKGHRHTLKAGRHVFPFRLCVGGSLPSSLSTTALGGVSVAYKLHAQAVKAGFGFHQNIQAIIPVPIIRSFAQEAMEYQHTLEIENSWPQKLMYSVMLPHKAWAAGDKVTAVLKCSPLTKGVSVLGMHTSIYEQTKVITRTGIQESSRPVSNVRHKIVNGKAVEIPSPKFGQNSTPSSPASPASPASASRHRHSYSFGGRFADSLSPSTSTSSSTDISSSTETPNEDSESKDLVALLTVPVPLHITPTHTLQPIQITHRIRWNIHISNPDGHTSELRCSLPLHLLDHRLLAEARAYSGPTRRLLLGLDTSAVQEEEANLLPSYEAHVRDRVANMYLPESAVVRVPNPWLSHGASPTFGPNHNSAAMTLPVCPPSRPASGSASGYATPSTLLEQGFQHLFNHLPHHPREDTNAPLNWINSELLISLSGGAPLRPPPAAESGVTTGEEEDRELISTQPDSRRHSYSGPRSRLPSRSQSPDGDHHRPMLLPQSSSSSTSSHSGHHHDAGHGGRMSNLLKHWLPSRSHSHHAALQPAADPVDRGRVQHPPHTSPTTSDTLDPNAVGAMLLHRAFTETPDYNVAARGFIGGVPPLSSLEGLPSYEEAAAGNIDA